MQVVLSQKLCLCATQSGPLAGVVASFRALMASMMALLMGDGDEAPDAAVRALSKQPGFQPLRS